MIKIYIENNKIGGHKNLVLEIPSIKLKEIADTYYFALDNGFRKDDESTTKVVDNLINLLNHWVNQVNSLKNNESVFLPFDFSDQYISGLEVNSNLCGEKYINYTTVVFNLGLPYNPSNYPNNFDLSIATSFHTENLNLKVRKDKIIKAIESSIKSLKKYENNIEWLN